jgi:hypothetical protein
MFVSDGDQVQVRDSACKSWSSGQNLGSPKGNGQVWAENSMGVKPLQALQMTLSATVGFGVGTWRVRVRWSVR